MGSKRRRRRRSRRRERPPRPPRPAGTFQPFRPSRAMRPPPRTPRAPRGGRLRSFERWVNSNRVGGWFCAVVAVICAVMAVATYQEAVALRDGERAVAEVVEVREARGGGDGSVVVRFRTREGREVVAELDNYRWDPKPRVGDTQEVLYDPEYPDTEVVDARIGPDFVVPWMLTGGFLVALVFAHASFTGNIDWRDWRR